MNSLANAIQVKPAAEYKSMQKFGSIFVTDLPRHVEKLRIPARKIFMDAEIGHQAARIDNVNEIQMTMREVLDDPVTR